MKFSGTLIKGRLCRRYKRFFADIELESGEVVTAHCPNTGSMRGCSSPGCDVLISKSDNPKRKLKYTWEMINNGRCWIGINTMLPNRIVLEALKNGKIAELQGFTEFKTEVKYGQNSRVDILAVTEDQKECYIEVKNVTLVGDDGFYKFPDAVTERGRKHLYELMDIVKAGRRAVMLFLIQRSDGTIFKPADDIDPKYAASLREAYAFGVEILPYQAAVSPDSVELTTSVDFILE